VVEEGVDGAAAAAPSGAESLDLDRISASTTFGGFRFGLGRRKPDACGNVRHPSAARSGTMSVLLRGTTATVFSIFLAMKGAYCQLVPSRRFLCELSFVIVLPKRVEQNVS
jgi:hypothetical protein